MEVDCFYSNFAGREWKGKRKPEKIGVFECSLAGWKEFERV